jgi:WW domain-containing oxidoreductase
MRPPAVSKKLLNLGRNLSRTSRLLFESYVRHSGVKLTTFAKGLSHKEESSVDWMRSFSSQRRTRDMENIKTCGARTTADEVLADLDLTGKTILVTGCNSDIGFVTIRALAARGAHIIGLARSLQSAREACHNAGGSATPVACDLADITSVVSEVDIVSSLGRTLDAIITNAGVMCPKKLVIRYGVELQFFVNHIAHFLLVNRLFGLVPTRTGRIVIVSSSASVDQAPKEGIMFDNLDGHRFYKPFQFYGQSKLANALFAKELSRRVERRGIAVNSLHPGAVGGTSLQPAWDFT